MFLGQSTIIAHLSDWIISTFKVLIPAHTVQQFFRKIITLLQFYLHFLSPFSTYSLHLHYIFCTFIKFSSIFCKFASTLLYIYSHSFAFISFIHSSSSFLLQPLAPPRQLRSPAPAVGVLQPRNNAGLHWISSTCASATVVRRSMLLFNTLPNKGNCVTILTRLPTPQLYVPYITPFFFPFFLSSSFLYFLRVATEHDVFFRHVSHLYKPRRVAESLRLIDFKRFYFET